MADNCHLPVTGPTIIYPDPTSCHFRRYLLGNQAGCSCSGGCKFDHKCFKRWTDHPATRCNGKGQKHMNSQSTSHPLLQNSMADNSRKSRLPLSTFKWLSFTLKNYLLQGFNFGFSIQFKGERRVFVPPNLKSTLVQLDIVRDKRNKEITAGQIASPFQDPHFPHIFCSPLGIVHKKNPLEVRLFHHLSFPQGFSVNDLSLGNSLPYLMQQLMTLFPR